MRDTVVTTVQALVAAAALAFASFSLATQPADAASQGVQHSCYSGCCSTCSGSLCCWGDVIEPAAE